MKNYTQKLGRGIEYSAPLIRTLDIAVEKGFATSTADGIPDAGYEGGWEE